MAAIPDGELLAFLEDPQSYPHRPNEVHLVQTHISYVAIVPPLVYKVKKPIDLGFLDFTTLARRRYFCEEEVRLNRRLCAEIYEAVVPIIRKRGELSFGDDGEVTEYAVRMKQLSDGRFMHQLIDQGKVEPRDLDRVVETLVEFYRRRPRTSEIAEWGRIDRLRLSTDENFRQTIGHVGVLLARPAFDALRFYVRRFFDCHSSLFARRRTNGHIVDGHGDLRLEHIHLTRDRVCIFDCIEFNTRFRYIDIASDVAFLAMDLDSRRRPDLARHVADRMAEVLSDPDLLTLLSFYKCYRAYVRGKVEGIRSTEDEVPDEERKVSRNEARRHYQLALEYAVAGAAPLVLVTMGRIGTGKSTQAKALGDALGWRVVSSDRTRKELAGVDLRERPDPARSRLYSEDMTERTYRALQEEVLDGAARSRSMILDATYSLARHRTELRANLERRGVPHRFVELSASDQTVRDRLRQRESEGAVSDARLEDMEKLTAQYQAPNAMEDIFHFVVSSETDAADTTAAVLKELIRRHE